MNKRSEIEKAVRNTITATGFGNLFSNQQIEGIVDQLEQLAANYEPSVNSEIVKKIITRDLIMKSLVDFGDTQYWLDQIVDIINKK